MVKLFNSLRLMSVGLVFISPSLHRTPDPNRPLFTHPDHTLELLKFPTHRLPPQPKVYPELDTPTTDL